MILFESIRWKNFLSTGDQWTEIELTESSSTLIVGANGAGKSTMLDALCFALFNKPFRKINRGQLVNSINEKGLKVEVCFTIGRDEYRVFRGAKPNVFELYKNNKLVDQDAAAKDTQKYLEQSVLKLNFKSFTQVVILGSSTFVPFMQLPAAHRREVIEDLLDINVFSNMNQLLKDRVRAATEQSKECQYMLSLARQKVDAQQKLIGTLVEVNENRQVEKNHQLVVNQDKVKTLKERIEERKTDLENREKGIFDTTEYNDMLDNLKQKKSDYTANLKRCISDHKFYTKHENCPSCGQHIDMELRQAKTELLAAQGVELNKAVQHVETQLDDTIDVIKKINEIALEFNNDKAELNNWGSELNRLESEAVEINRKLLELQQNTPNIDSEEEVLFALNKEYMDTQRDCSEVSRQLDEYNVTATLLKDSGIKRQIIKKYVPVFNNLINKYLHSMDFFVNFTLDEEFNEVIKSRFRDEFSYSSFSEGEKQKIDLALLFTWREVARMKNSVATNLLILDEVFDSSLDASGTAELLQILRGLGNDSNVFVISHKGEILVDKFLRTIKFEKINDFSKMSDDS
ncbi:recombination-related endonuclease [Synechococcus phage S-P4]|uniref:Recombination-related endonuclease n=1 Tax=Synechococcus phage S-P4 TaxID=2484640 RepID=A0A3G3M7G4_9CAUD|nr:SbcC-like subunit of palindrome specific endonuclease [Synechococcus phage S-P4]AYR01878.1 recombination-related endonuclease [Synechococcus phage S-P4]